LQRGAFAQHPSITAVADRIEIMRVVFREKRVARPQGGVMHAEMFLEHLAASADGSKTFARRGCLAIIPAQIGPRLLALENRGDGPLSGARAIGSNIRAVAALGQTDFRGAGGIAVGLRPQKREPLESEMRLRFRAADRYWRVHSASSFAQ
jgi:hypothetical protein